MTGARGRERPGGRWWIALLLSLAAASCGSLGARTAQVDQASYAVALGEAQKRQLLANIVRMRYGEPASFVTLDQIVQGYTLGGAANAEVDLGLLGDETPILGGNLTYEDRPTLTLTPIQGRDFRNGFLVPRAAAVPCLGPRGGLAARSRDASRSSKYQRHPQRLDFRRQGV